MGFHLLLAEWPILVLSIKGWDLDAVSGGVFTRALSPSTASIDVFELQTFLSCAIQLAFHKLGSLVSTAVALKRVAKSSISGTETPVNLRPNFRL